VKDYYKILELPPSATLKEIKTAYRRLAHQYHPDKVGNDRYAAAQFDIIKEAYEILSNPVKKEYYLQQRWYEQSINRQTTKEALTPVTILKQMLQLEKYVSALDTHRMDKAGLSSYISSTLSEDTIEKLNAFTETDINKSIVVAALKSSRYLPYSYAKFLTAKLKRLNTDALTVHKINQYLQHSRNSATWNKYKVWLVFLVVILLCLLIYAISR
jgi:curved DNA-binding protein CbpA